MELTDEHIIPDGVGGDLVLPKSSCKSCAAITSRAELHLLREVFRFVRGVVGLRSKKRKSPRPVVSAKFEEASNTEEQELDVNDTAPFMLAFPVTDDLPARLGGKPLPPDTALRLAIFGDRDWVERAGKWMGRNGSFKFGTRFHPGIVGQALAKIAHAYACAVVGPDGFHHELTEYILTPEPPMFLGNIGIFASEGVHDDALHYIDLLIADAPVQTAVGVGLQKVLVVYIRLFAARPSPSILVVVGRPNGVLDPPLQQLDLGRLR